MGKLSAKECTFSTSTFLCEGIGKSIRNCTCCKIRSERPYNSTSFMPIRYKYRMIAPLASVCTRCLIKLQHGQEVQGHLSIPLLTLMLFFPITVYVFQSLKYNQKSLKSVRFCPFLALVILVMVLLEDKK